MKYQGKCDKYSYYSINLVLYKNYFLRIETKDLIPMSIINEYRYYFVLNINLEFKDLSTFLLLSLLCLHMRVCSHNTLCVEEAKPHTKHHIHELNKFLPFGY